LTASKLTKAFGGNQVLRGVDVAIEPGSVVLLRGPNGCGKTTLINVLTGNLRPDSGRICVKKGTEQASFDFPAPWMRKITPPFFSTETFVGLGLGRSWQDVRLFGRQTVLNNVAIAAPSQPGEDPFLGMLRPRAARAREREVVAGAMAVLRDLGLDSLAAMPASALTTCEAKRLAIVRTVYAGASLLFLDEPLSGLDESEVEIVLDLLAALVSARQTSLVIVEHTFNILPILEFATEVWTMSEGTLTIENPDVVRSRVLQETGNLMEALMRSIPSEGRITEHIDVCDSATLSIIRRLGRAQTPAIEIQGLTVARGSQIVVGRRGPFDLRLEAGDLAILSAPNGWGKTTLCDAIAGLVPYKTGAIRFEGAAFRDTASAAAAGLGYLRSQDNLFDSLTIRENLRLFDVPHAEAWNLSRVVDSLSGGERQRLAWQIATQRQPRVLLLDEPFLSLDVQTVRRLLEDLSKSVSSAVLLCLPKQRTSLNRRHSRNNAGAQAFTNPREKNL
jgi:ABC-type branched-subunit amino acid transport system ATPase component